MKTNIKRTILLGISLEIVFLLVLLTALRQPPMQEERPVDTAGTDTASISLLSAPVVLTGNKTLSEINMPLLPQQLGNRDAIKVVYNLHGLCLLGGAASSLDVRSGATGVHSVPLATAGKNCLEGTQSVDVPLESSPSPVSLHISLWYPTAYTVDIQKIIAYTAGAAVLGTTTEEQSPREKKTSETVSVIRKEPYAKENLPD